MTSATALLVVAGALAPGPYRVVYDRVETEQIVQDVLCEDLPPPKAADKGAPFALTVDSDTFLLDGGARKLGTGACDAETATVAPTKVTRTPADVVVHCKSQRVVRGTEEGDSTYRFRADRTIEVRTVMERRWRHVGQMCALRRVRSTMFEPAPAVDAPVEQIVADAARQTDYAEIKITHQNKMPASYVLISTKYELDTKPLLKDEKDDDWGPLPPGRVRAVYGGLVAQGPHVLSVEVVYEAPGPAHAIKLKLRDTVFFDAVDRPATIDVVCQERGGLFAELKDQAMIDFVVDGAANVSKDEPKP